ncbi:MAG: pyridoxal phosphate-dependent aminotransferase family protein, partial [Methylococcales bacterium]|nr:pyridoxal phosphate-dependent aminotransferase family protein [Methylococcales bacterium]
MLREMTLAKLPLTPDTMWDIPFYKKSDLYFYLEATENLLPNGRVHVTNYGDMIMLGGYSYLDLIGHPKINAAAKAAVDRYGTGTHGVRLLAGSLTLHNELETRIASFKQAEAAITMSSGYVTNLSTISSLLRKGDTLICDKLNHASIVDGCLLSMAKFVRFRHNDMPHLEKRLREANGNGRILVVVDAVFSMDGDIADLPTLLALAERYDAWLIVDDAHGFGVHGAQGRGSLARCGLSSERVIYMGTLGKA